MSKYDYLFKLATRFEVKLATVPMTSIDIPQYHFDTLARWASVGRTIDSAIDMIEGLSGYVDETDNYVKGLLDDKMHVVQELRDVKQALDACHNAIKSKAFTIDNSKIVKSQ